MNIISAKFALKLWPSLWAMQQLIILNGKVKRLTQILPPPSSFFPSKLSKMEPCCDVTNRYKKISDLNSSRVGKQHKNIKSCQIFSEQLRRSVEARFLDSRDVVLRHDQLYSKLG